MLIERAQALCSEKKTKSLALTFEPSPRAFFKPNLNNIHLFTKEQKKKCFQELNLDALIIQKFDEDFSKISHVDFFEKFLRDFLNVSHITIGHDFHFGYKRQGTPLWLKKKCDHSSIPLKICEARVFQDEEISSSRIRSLLQLGEVEQVTSMLGRPYLLAGVIRKGNQLGRTIGFPTINLSEIKQLIPKTGVYMGHVWLEEDRLKSTPSIMSLPNNAIPAVFNIGTRPSFSELGNHLQIEAHLLSGCYGPNQLYDLKAGFYFSHFLREERLFPEKCQLIKQIEADIRKAKSFLK